MLKKFETVSLDGSHGEGGGQILRTALSLSLITGKAFMLENIRARRDPPGLRPQHRASVLAAAEIGEAIVEGAEVGSHALEFRPKEIKHGEFKFKIGTAGSTTLVLQTVLPPLLFAKGPSVVTVEGGTYNRHAPPFEFFAKAFLPLVACMGPEVSATLIRPGFYPAGGGRARLRVKPAPLGRLELPPRDAPPTLSATAIVANLPPGIAHRELGTIERSLGIDAEHCRPENVDAHGPGNAVWIEARSKHVTEIFSGIGEKGKLAEVVADGACAEARIYLASDASVAEHLADQLLLPLALGGGGSFSTTEITRHFTTNAEVIAHFLPAVIKTERKASRWEISVETTWVPDLP